MGNRRNLWRFVWKVRREHNMDLNCLPNDIWTALRRTRFGGTTQTRLGRVNSRLNRAAEYRRAGEYDNARIFLADARHERERLGDD